MSQMPRTGVRHLHSPALRPAGPLGALRAGLAMPGKHNAHAASCPLLGVVPVHMSCKAVLG